METADNWYCLYGTLYITCQYLYQMGKPTKQIQVYDIHLQSI